MTVEIQIVKRDSVPALREVVVDGVKHDIGEVRDLRGSEELRRFMPDASLISVSWAKLAPHRTHEPHVHPIQSMMVIFSGAGELIGQVRRPIQEGDVVVVPAGCEHGFIAGSAGLAALSIQFGDPLYTADGKPRAVFSQQESEHGFQDLLRYNESRSIEFASHPLITLLHDGTLDDPRQRSAYRRSMRDWKAILSNLLLWRQASCTSELYRIAFWEDVANEKLLGTSPAGPPEDVVLAAIDSWFSYQMLSVDDLDKAAISYLVIENARAQYHRALVKAARPEPSSPPSNYPDASISEERMERRLSLFRGQAPQTYTRLRTIVGEAWDMVNAMGDRVVALTMSVDTEAKC